jgi:hypothetical protein
MMAFSALGPAWAGKLFFFEKKNQKTFVPFGTRPPAHASQIPKVFWFFFSKKNSLPYPAPQGPRNVRQ